MSCAVKPDNHDAPPWPPLEMAELLDALAGSADRLEISYSETAHIARHAAETIRRLVAHDARLTDMHRDMCRVAGEQVAEIERLRGDHVGAHRISMDTIRHLEAEIERLESCLYAQEAVKPLYDEIERLQELLRDIGANRYWEGRWRDAKAENERLLAAIRDAHALIENDLAIPWIMAHKLDAILGVDVQSPPENELLPPKSATRIPVTVTPRGPGKMNPND